ncbi:2-phosphosulfolactate phosphatase [Fusobacterium sp. SYSU M8A802]
MRIDIIDTAGNVTFDKIKGKTVIIIDVLRATSVMITALANGVKGIYPYRDIESVLENSKLDINPLLCGERKGLKIDGFHCGNSPLEYKRELIEDRNMYMTTSNGTRAIESCIGAERVYIAAFLNIEGVVKQIIKDEKDVVIICSGTDDNFSKYRELNMDFYGII